MTIPGNAPGTPPEPNAQQIKEAAEKIAASGQDVRQRIETLVQKITQEVGDGSRKLVDVAQDVLDGAAAGIKKAAPPDDQENRLRQVIDGLGDGFTKAANATRLAIEEAASRGERFAQQDIKDMTNDLKALRDMFVDVVSRTTSRAGTAARSEASDTAQHVKRTYESLKPSLQKAIDAAKDDPNLLAKETVHAVTQASRQAAGALFSAVGNLLHQAADRLDPAPGTAPGTSPRTGSGAAQSGKPDASDQTVGGKATGGEHH